MNVQSMLRAGPLILAGFMLLAIVVASHYAGSPSAAERYGECVRLTASDPAGALEKAKAWRARHPASPMARHCEALALYAAKDYAGAAEELAGLAAEASAQNAPVSLSLLLQAVNAYKAAGQDDKAINLISAEIAHAGDDQFKALLLTERAKTYLAMNRPLMAVQDLDYAATLAPGDKAVKSLLIEISEKSKPTNPDR